MKIRIAICDDQEIFVDHLEEMLRQLDFGNNNISIDKFTAARPLIDQVRSGNGYNIIFMDIDLKGDYLGTDTGSMIKALSPKTLMVYMSSYENYFEKLAHAEPFEFLRKPLNHDNVQDIIYRAVRRLNYIYAEYMYTYKSHGLSNVVNLKDVVYFESQHRVVNIVMNNNTVSRFYDKLDMVEQQIDRICDFFLRISKSYLINLMCIRSVRSTSITMSNDIELNIGRKYLDHVHQTIKNIR